MNHHVHHFDMGLWLLFLAYIVSVTGSVVGLACTRLSAAASDERRSAALARHGVDRHRRGGDLADAFHRDARLRDPEQRGPVPPRMDGRVGGAVDLGSVRRADHHRPDRHLRRLIAGGVITGLAVALMHYTGMWAVQIQGTISYNKGLVALSILIAVVAATAALWFTLVLESPVLRFAAGLVMGVAVVGMHYTGMAAVRVTVDHTAPVPGGPEVFSFLFPVFVIGLLALAVPITAVMLASDRVATEKWIRTRPRRFVGRATPVKPAGTPRAPRDNRFLTVATL